jgi:O-antigen/teichoic acid export membrane protein
MTSANAGQNLHLTSGRLLARNTIWNLSGNGAPLLVAVFSIPILIHALGKDRFGILALAWALIGYASLFDIGLGRALTQLVARKLGAGEEREIPALVWTSLLLMLALGAFGAVVVFAISPWLVHRALKISEALQSETVRAFYLLGLSIPVVIVTAGLRGLLEAHQRFKLVNYLRIPMGVFTFVGPLLVLPFSNSLVPVVGILVAGRVVGCAGYALLCHRVVPELHRRVAWHGPSAAPLIRFGGWATVTNIVGPMMLYLDRFVIGGMVSATAVAYYATPFEVVSKLFILTGAISAVMFPAFSMSDVADRNRSVMLYRRTLGLIVAGLLPLVIVMILGAKPGLTLWLGIDFAAHSYRVAQLLLVGAFFLGAAALPFGLLQGLGRPDIPAKLNLIEIPFYLVGLYFAVKNFGVTGAAVTWMLRATIDGLLLAFFAHRLQTAPALKFAENQAVSLVSVGQ